MQRFSTVKYFLNLYNDPKISAWSILVKDRVTEIGYLSVQPKSFLNRAFSSFHLLKFVGTFDYFFFQSFSVTSVLDFEKSSKMAKNYEEKPFFLEQLQNPDFKTSTQFITKYS